jgi:hypothetical protein
MRLRSVVPGRGAAWVRDGFRTFGRYPLGYSGLFAAFLFVIFLLTVVPFVGPMLLLAVLPLGSLGFMLATRAAQGGKFPLPTVFLEPLRSGRERQVGMVKLGLIYASCSILIIWVSDRVDGGALEALMQALGTGRAEPREISERLIDSRLQFGLMLRFGLAALLSVPFWHAPALVHWDGQGVAQSLFSSTVACWRNKGAFLVFGLVWTAVVLVFALAANIIGRLMGAPQLVALLAMPASLILSTAFYASLYFTFADCFDDSRGNATPTTPTTTETDTP